jgi:hypothetical protein
MSVQLLVEVGKDTFLEIIHLVECKNEGKILIQICVSRHHHNLDDKMEPEQAPFASLLCPPPVNVILTANTFVHFLHENSVKVCLVLTINPLEKLLSIHLFLTWNEVKSVLGN